MVSLQDWELSGSQGLVRRPRKLGNFKVKNVLVLNSLRSSDSNADMHPLAAYKECRKSIFEFPNRMTLEIWRHLAAQHIFCLPTWVSSWTFLNKAVVIFLLA